MTPDSINEEERSINCIIATENPSLVVDWDEWEVIREVLLCTPDAVIIPENRQIPLLDTHWRFTSDDLKGSIRNLAVENGELAGRAFFDSSEDKLWGKVRDRHLTDTSAGYRTFKNHSLRIKAGEKGSIAGRTFENNYGDNFSLVIRSKWEIKEGSAVAIGADSTSKFRSELLTQGDEIKKLIEKLQSERSITEELINNQRNTNLSIKNKEPHKMDENTKTPEEILKDENARRKELRETAKRMTGRIKDIDKLRESAEDEGWSIERFNGEIVTRLANGEQFGTPASDLDLSKKEKKNYRVWNLVRSVMEKNPDIAGLERECSNEISKRLGQAPNGFYVEYGHLKREITIAAPGTASALVAVELMANNFLDLLYNKMVFGSALNVKMINGLVGNLDFPRKVSSSEGYYIGEGDAATESDINFGLQRMSPKTVSAIVKYSRQTALQATPEMEYLVLDDVVSALKRRADRAYLNGAGGDEVTGLLLQDGVQILDAANFSFDTAVDFETELEDANFDLDKAIWLCTPRVKGTLRKRKIEAGQTAKLWEKDLLVDRTGFATRQMPDNTIALVEPSEIIVGTWGVLDIQINRLNDDGGVKIIPFWSHDMINRRGNGTVKGTNFS
ncbi:MAG: phage major capsid protein [Candidatus Roizmanbacteria bacterium]|nr:phage major capsid protein [Candidatus Roizmanbacteria bacterium]